jgi:hypothetical protein
MVIEDEAWFKSFFIDCQLRILWCLAVIIRDYWLSGRIKLLMTRFLCDSLTSVYDRCETFLAAFGRSAALSARSMAHWSGFWLLNCWLQFTHREAGMAFIKVLIELVLPVIGFFAQWTFIRPIFNKIKIRKVKSLIFSFLKYQLVLSNSLPLILVPSLVVLFVAYTSEHSFAVLAFVGFLASVSSKVNH